MKFQLIYIFSILFLSLHCSKSGITLTSKDKIKKPSISTDWELKTIETKKFLKDLIQIKTVRGNEIEAARYIEKLLKSEGISSRIIPCPKSQDKVNLIAELLPEPGKETGKGIIITNHLDVVETEPKEWTYPPFEAREVNGRIYGRGAIDMKGMAAIELAVFLEFKRSKIPLKRKLMYLSFADEESGSNCGGEFLTQKMPELFKDYEYAINEGGIGTIDVAVKDSKVFNLQYAEKGVLWVDVKATGLSGHGSTPHPEYASKNLVAFLNDLNETGFPLTISDATEKFFYEMGNISPFPNSFLLKRSSNYFVKKILKPVFAENRHLNAMTHNTVSITGLKTMEGSGHNVVASESFAKLDFRLLPGTDPKEFLKEIQTRADKYKIIITPTRIDPPTTSPIDTEFFKNFGRVAIENVPGAIVTPFLSPGSTDNTFLRRIGIHPYGLIPFLLRSEDIDTMHGKDESVTIENLRLGTKILFESIYSMN